MEHARRDVDGLSSMEPGFLVAEAHLALSFEDEIDLFLILVVPGHLPAVWIERDVSKREIGGLDRARAANEILSQSPRGIRTSGDICKVRDDHRLKNSKMETAIHVNDLSGAVVESAVCDCTNGTGDLGWFAHAALG